MPLEPDLTITREYYFIAGYSMQYEWLLPFILLGKYSHLDAWQLLMILWDMHWDLLCPFTLEQVVSIKAAFEAWYKCRQNNGELRLFLMRCAYVDKRNLLPSREKRFAQAIKSAEKMNAALDRMSTEILSDVLLGEMYTKLSGKEILRVARARNQSRLHPSRLSVVPSEFRGRESEMPIRTTAWAKRMWPDFHQGVVDIAAEQKQKWIKDAKMALGRVEIGMKNDVV
ncbi:MAG: hypothetical protein LQ352_004496 [Teloschistes flavicans]|nr:MAG: hypothetical protein LQ352_004496 [Teloschistes flavicans]